MIKHLACIMDGNRRWAQGQGWDILKGHDQGAQTVKVVAQFCLDNKIPYLSLFALSTENLGRPQREVAYLFDLIARRAQESLHEFQEKNIRVRFVGDRALFPPHLIPILDHLEQQTAGCTQLNLNFLFCYGARQEILGGVKAIARALQAGAISDRDLENLSLESFKNYLWLGNIPDPEIIIRPGKFVRLSNFMLYQAAYSEWYFPNCLWPEVTVELLREIMADFAVRKRNFGK